MDLEDFKIYFYYVCMYMQGHMEARRGRQTLWSTQSLLRILDNMNVGLLCLLRKVRGVKHPGSFRNTPQGEAAAERTSGPSPCTGFAGKKTQGTKIRAH